MKNDPAFVVIIKTGSEDKYFLMMTEEKGSYSVHGFKEEQDAINYFENGYVNCHGRSYESSMSACVNYIFTQPSIVRAPGIDWIKRLVGPDAKLHHFGSVAGMFDGIPLPKKKGSVLWNRGRKPSLWPEEKIQKSFQKQEINERFGKYET